MKLWLIFLALPWAWAKPQQIQAVGTDCHMHVHPQGEAFAYDAARVLSALGMNRILLGSDWPLLHPSEHVAALRAFPLSPEERDLIIAGNALRLFPTENEN